MPQLLGSVHGGQTVLVQGLDDHEVLIYQNLGLPEEPLRVTMRQIYGRVVERHCLYLYRHFGQLSVYRALLLLRHHRCYGTEAWGLELLQHHLVHKSCVILVPSAHLHQLVYLDVILDHGNLQLLNLSLDLGFLQNSLNLIYIDHLILIRGRTHSMRKLPLDTLYVLGLHRG